MKGLTLTLSLSKGERRPKAAKGEAGSAHFFNGLPGRVRGAFFPGREGFVKAGGLCSPWGPDGNAPKAMPRKSPL